jgi:glycosyltransferase involved in cell wall biosynthesis
VLDGHPGARLLIVGGGEREQVVRERVRAINRPAVIYRPRVPHDQIGRYYSVVDWLVYPRRRVRLTELVTPLKPLEAMAMNKAVIASDVGGHREMVEDGRTGLLFRAQSGDDLVRVLGAAASDDGLRSRLAEAGRRYILECRNWDAVAANYRAAYAAAAGGL